MLFDKKHKWLVCLSIIVLIFSSQCKKKVEFSDDTFNGGKVMILGHRGMGEYYKMPGNTFESLNPLIAIGADGSEIDIQMTKDTVLVCFHDHFLNSVTNCSGRIYESNWAEIKECKYYAIQNMIFIYSLDELLGKIPNVKDLYFSFDCSKVDNDVEDIELYRSQYLRAIKTLCEKYDMTDNIFLEGDEALLLKAQNMGLKNKLFLFGAMNQGLVDAAYLDHFYGISTSIDWLEVDPVVAHEKGLFVMVWSPNNESQNKFALEKKADIIQTDSPITILKLLNRYNYEYVIP